jgi:hypothetical protein
MATSTIGRRAALRFVAGAPALAATAAMAAAAGIPAAHGISQIDPIFAAIERHKGAWEAFGATCSRTDHVLAEQEGREVTEADEAAWRAANELEEDVFEALVTLPPVNVAGMRAVIEYFVDFELDCIPDGPSKFLSALLQSPLLAAGGDNV